MRMNFNYTSSCTVHFLLMLLRVFVLVIVPAVGSRPRPGLGSRTRRRSGGGTFLSSGFSRAILGRLGSGARTATRARTRTAPGPEGHEGLLKSNQRRSVMCGLTLIESETSTWIGTWNESGIGSWKPIAWSPRQVEYDVHPSQYCPSCPGRTPWPGDRQTRRFWKKIEIGQS